MLIAVYGTLAISLDLLAGHAGLLSMAHAAFYGIGAYSSALLTVYRGAPFWVGIGVGAVVAALLSLVVSLPSLRLRGDYFVISTFAFQMITSTVLNNWTHVTRGPMGIPAIPPPSVFGASLSPQHRMVAVSCILLCLNYLVVARICTSPFGRVLRVIREDDLLVGALGKNSARYKVTAFAVSGAVAAVAGSIYAHSISYIDPTSFTVMESILVLSMVIIGGAASRLGPLIGAAILVSLPEALRFVGLPISVAAHLRQVVYGVLLVMMMLARPRGVMGRYEFGSKRNG